MTTAFLQITVGTWRRRLGAGCVASLVVRLNVSFLNLHGGPLLVDHQVGGSERDPEKVGTTRMKIEMRLSAISVIGAVVLLSCTAMTPTDVTYTAILETIYRIHLYTKLNGVLPTSIDVLPIQKNHINRTVDGWQRPLNYELTPDGLISLKSLGRDGLQGGDGEDKDIIAHCSGKDEMGHIIASDALWTTKQCIINLP
ncbi:MAG: type II secretion system protein GspG [Candidatus Contendobacter sp.]